MYKVKTPSGSTELSFEETVEFLTRRKYYNYDYIENIDAKLLNLILRNTIFKINTENIPCEALLEVIDSSNIRNLYTNNINEEFVLKLDKELLALMEYSDRVKEILNRNKIVLEYSDIMLHPTLLAYVNSEILILRVLNLKPEYCKYVTYFTDEICKNYIKIYPSMYKHLKGELNAKYAKDAVSIDGMLLQYVEVQSEEIVMLAIKRHYNAIRFIKEKKLIEYAKLEYEKEKALIAKRNLDLDRRVLKRCCEGYKFITNLTPSIFEELVQQGNREGVEYVSQKFYKEVLDICSSKKLDVCVS